MSELGGYLRERFEQIVDPIDIDALVEELQTGERIVSPLPPQRRDRGRGLLVAAAAAAVVLIAGAAWLLFARGGDVAPADQPIDEDSAIGVVEQLFDAFNRNDFDGYVALLGDQEVANAKRAGDSAAIISFSHDLQGAWELNTCWAFDLAASVQGIGVTCNASYQSGVNRLLGAAPQHETLHFRVGTDGRVEFTEFEPPYTDFRLVWDLAIETVGAQIPEGVDPETLDLVDPCNVITEEGAGWQFTRACSDWIWEQVDALYEDG